MLNCNINHIHKLRIGWSIVYHLWDTMNAFYIQITNTDFTKDYFRFSVISITKTICNSCELFVFIEIFYFKGSMVIPYILQSKAKCSAFTPILYKIVNGKFWRFNSKQIICWYHFGCKKAWNSEYIVTFIGDVIIKSTK